MKRGRSLPRVADGDEPVARRVATGLHKIGLALRNQAWAGAGQRGLTPTQGQILGALRTRALRLAEIAAALGVTAPTASDAVRALVDKGLVAKEKDPDDARAVRHRLTAAGESEARSAAAWPDFLVDAVDTLEPAEQEVFLVGLIKMIRSLQERGQIPVARMCVTCTHFRPRVHDDAARPHHCAFVDAPLGDGQLRVDCDDHVASDADGAAALWARFAAR
jgi:DNA-binding MarR family transcriptional regulator